MARLRPAGPLRGPAHARRARHADRVPMRASLLGPWLAFKRLTELGFPRRFPIVQFPNLPLIVALLAAEAGTFIDGAGHQYAVAVAYLATAIWAGQELVQG